MNTPSFREDHSSQIPALQLLQNLGWTYMPPDLALYNRGGKESNVLLEGVLEEQLRKLNQIVFRGQTHKFSDTNIQNAIQVLKDFPIKDGLIRTNEQVYELLTLGKSFEQRIEGDKKSFNLKYIDWKQPENNLFTVTEEYSVEKPGGQGHYRPDLVLFVNGIPLVVIECKRPDIKEPLRQAISQHNRNEKMDGIPHLYIYSQLVLSLASNDAKYATTGTEERFWSYWKEQLLTEEVRTQYESDLFEIKNRPLSSPKKDLLFQNRFKYVRSYFDEMESAPLQPTKQDRLLNNLCHPDRILDLISKFIVFDAGIKKICRYQQYFGVQNTLKRISNFTEGKRTGGVVWHTQGSGKSLTMVMMAKSIALNPEIRNPRIILVTDRVDLDDQIYRTFQNCEIEEVIQAKSGTHLMELIKAGKDAIITTLIHKFDAGMRQAKIVDKSSEIFVLIDESHRSQYGEANLKMQKVFPNACYIGFTGTPLMKKDKSTAMKFGGIIDKYTIDQAVEDGAVVPLLYEGRHVVQDLKEKVIDDWFEMISRELNTEQKADLKKKFARADQLNEADQKIWRIAWDVSLHWEKEWKGSGFKAQLTAPSKAAALQYKKYLDQIGTVNTEVVISGPDSREGHEDIYEEADETIQRFWKNMMQRFGNEKAYNKKIIDAFKAEGDPEIIIVVDKLLTGFDAPRNLVLYITRSLREHTLLQAIARVNRLYEGKDYGYILDYYGILGELDEALTTYSSLSDFDEEDLSGTLTNVREEVKKLAERHAQLWDLFKEIPNRMDLEAYQQLLADIALREQFYDRLSLFARTLKIALSTMEFIRDTPEQKIKTYKDDAKFFLKLRKLVKNRYAEVIDYKQYENQIQKLIDSHVSADEVIQITPLTNIFEKEKFEEEVMKIEGKVARADTIANRTTKYISEKLDEDPAFYKKFSAMLRDVIEAFRQKRISEAEYLEQVTVIMHNVQDRTGDDTPASLSDNEDAKAFFGITEPVLAQVAENQAEYRTLSADIALKIDEIIKRMAIVDWQQKADIQNKMRQEIEDYLFSIKGRHSVGLNFDHMDEIIDNAIEIAKHRL